MRWITALAAIVLGLYGRPSAAWSDLIVFGDSLSDTGNLASITTDFPWPYYRNRVSNGPLAVDVLADGWGLSAEASLHLAGKPGGGNYAVDGSNAGGDQAEDLPAQLQAYLDRHAGKADADSLYVVMIGGNDLRSARNSSDPLLADRIVDAAVAVIGETVATLLAGGADRIVVVNGPDIGRIPETLERELQEPGVAARATRLTQQFNTALAARLASLPAQSGAKIVQFDLFAYFNRLLTNATAHGFANTTEGCFDPKRYAFHADCEWGSRFDRFVFFDSLHPTAKVHRLIGEAMFEVLSPTSKPNSIAPFLLLLLE